MEPPLFSHGPRSSGFAPIIGDELGVDDRVMLRMFARVGGCPFIRFVVVFRLDTVPTGETFGVPGASLSRLLPNPNVTHVLFEKKF